MNIENAFKIIEEKKEENDFAGHINNESIAEAEHILNITFPASHIKFLEKYGCGSLFGMEIYGIVSDTNIEGKGVPSLVWLTKKLRAENNAPFEYVPVAFADDGGYYVLDTSKMENNECPILIWETGNFSSEKAYDNFAHFLLSQISIPGAASNNSKQL